MDGVGRNRFDLKAMQGLGRKRADWVNYMYEFMDTEFEHMFDLGVKVTSSTLLEIAVHSLNLP